MSSRNVALSREKSAQSVRRLASLAWHSSFMSLSSSTRGTAVGNLKKSAHRLKVEKCSPRVIPLPTPSVELHDIHMLHWQKTFDTMGGLKRLQPSGSVPTEYPHAVPYHCPATGRQFQFHYRQDGQVKPLVLPPIQGQAKKKHDLCNRIQLFNLPISDKYSMMEGRRIVNPLKSGEAQRYEVKRHIPKSTVVVRWCPTRHGTEWTADEICHLMQRFGLVVFTIFQSDTSMMVTYEDIHDAYSAVNDKSLPRGVVVIWKDPKFHNYGHYNSNKNYTVSTDKVWMDFVYSESKVKCIERVRQSYKPTTKVITIDG